MVLKIHSEFIQSTFSWTTLKMKIGKFMHCKSICYKTKLYNAN